MPEEQEKNLDWYYARIILIRDWLVKADNDFPPEGIELWDVTDEQLAEWGLTSDKIEYERKRLDCAEKVDDALKKFSEATV